MTQAIQPFLASWGPSFNSTMHRIELRNVRQGGNDFLAAGPLALQTMWAGSMIGLVAKVASGPLYAIAQFFRLAFSPFVCFPVSLFSCAAREGFYDRSVKAIVSEKVSYFERGARVDAPIKGTATLLIDGAERHFELGNDISWFVDNTIEEGGKIFWIHRLRAGEFFDSKCREVVIQGARVRVRISSETHKRNTVERKVGERTFYYELGKEVLAPVQATINGAGWGEYYLLNEIPNETENCIKIRSPKQMLYYDTGNELDAPTPTSRSFVIDGKRRHFASVTRVKSESLGLSGWVNAVSKKLVRVSLLPDRLSKTSAKIFRLVNRHLSSVVRISIIVASVALAYFGQTAMAVGGIAAVTYEMLDHDLGVVPRRVSLFMEKWMPMISMAGLLIVGSPLSQMMAAASLLLMVPEIKLYVHHKVSKVLRKPILDSIEQATLFGIRRSAPNERAEAVMKAEIKKMRGMPYLEEFDAPIVRREWDAKEIDEILQAEEDDYELNPAFLTKDKQTELKLEESKNFSALIEHWDQVGENWKQPAYHSRLCKRLADDKRFILFLQERFPEAKRFHFDNAEQGHRIEEYAAAQALHLRNIEDWILLLAKEKGISKEQFIADWVKQQLRHYLTKIDGSRPIEGEQRYLKDAVENTAKIIPFLTRPETSAVDREDALVKLAIEGGDYCALAMKRASSEVLEGFTRPLLVDQERQMDPNKRLENELFQTFKMGRLQAFQGFYTSAMDVFRTNEALKDVADDVHLYAAVTRLLKRGFYPMDKDEMADFSMTELLLAESALLPLRFGLTMEVQKRIPEAMVALGIDRGNILRNRVLEYLRSWVQTNSRLKADEKEALLNGALSNNLEQLADPDNHPKWHRLMLTITGIYRKKRVVAA